MRDRNRCVRLRRMRFSLSPKCSIFGAGHVAIIEESRVAIRSIWPSSLSFNEWGWTWIDGRAIRLRVPIYSVLRKPHWDISADGEIICQGELFLGFCPWKSRGLVWKCDGRELVHSSKAGLSSQRNLLTSEDGRLIAAWCHHLCRIDGVIRKSAAGNLIPAAFGVAVASYVVKDDASF